MECTRWMHGCTASSCVRSSSHAYGEGNHSFQIYTFHACKPHHWWIHIIRHINHFYLSVNPFEYPLLGAWRHRHWCHASLSRQTIRSWKRTNMRHLNRTCLSDLGLRNRGTFLETNISRSSNSRELLPGDPPAAPDPTVAWGKKNPGRSEGPKSQIKVYSIVFYTVFFYSILFYSLLMCFIARYRFSRISIWDLFRADEPWKWFSRKIILCRPVFQITVYYIIWIKNFTVIGCSQSCLVIKWRSFEHRINETEVKQSKVKEYLLFNSLYQFFAISLFWYS